MSYNILSENDLDDIPDFDGSLSSNNSDNEKVDSSLIKKILSEMKSEFSRGTSGSTTDTVEKFDSSDEAVQIDDKDDVKVDIQKLIEQNLNSIESCDEHQICDDNSSTPISEELSNNHIILSNTVFEPQETRNEEKPRIILTLRTSEEDRENCNWPEKRSNHILCQSTSDETDAMVLSTDQRERDSVLIESSSQIDLKETMSECRTRRSLRSQSMMKDENDVDKRSKRSSRRFSKENGRESVLQNAIARKEKSFNALNQSEERSYRRGARSPRHCSNESKPVRICSRTKSPKAQIVSNCSKQTECDNLEINGAEVISSDKEIKVKSEYDTYVVIPSINIIELKNSEADVKKSEVKTQVTVNPKDNPNLFTKTGKRRPRYRYFKGLKYSLTGGSVRKKALKLARKKKTIAPTQDTIPDPTPALDEHTCGEESPLILPSVLDISPSPSIPSPSYIPSSTPPLPTVCSSSNLLLININSPLTVNNDNVTSTCTEEVDNHVEIKHEVEESSELCSSVTETNCNEVIDIIVETKPDSIMEPRIESTLDVKCEPSLDPELSLTVADAQFSDVASEPCPLEEQEIQHAAVDSHQSGTEEDSSTEIKNEPVEGSLTQVVGIKRKHLSDEGEEENDKGSEKRCRQDTASPSTGEGDIEPDTPESTAITYGVGSAGLCLCNSRLELYASANSFRTELYCQAVDSLDERLIGCCNTVDKENARLVRPSVRVPYLVLCDIHHQRLRRHNCCPGCGNFCTQGKFLQCSLNHHYHKDCQLTEDNKTMCPHCGSESDMNINISLGAHKYPVFLPLQKPPKTVPSAKMTIGGCKNLPPAADTEGFSSSLPLVPAAALILPSGLQITAQGLPPSLDKDKLEHLLHVACNIHSQPQQRYTLRNMYQAAKNGDAEKMIYMLASGLNPNHVFREWIMGSALHAASSGGHLSVVHLLLQSGANTDVLDRDQNTPLMLACSNGHNEVVKYLVKAGASVTFKGGDGMTALHLAAKSGNLEACYYLISNPNAPRSYIDSVDDGRWTPLVWAAEHRHTDVVKFLLEKRADPLVRDAEQNIALHWAALAGSVDISEALLNYGSDINSTNAHADTPLHIAARQNVYECVLLLLARGARVDVHNRVGFLPLDCCMVNPSDAYTAIKLNVELRALMLNVQKRSQRILTNDITRGHEGNPIQCVNAVDDEAEPQDFIYIMENCFTSNINIDRTITSLQSCKCRDVCSSGSCMCGKISIRCWYDDEGKLLPEFNFADPPMLFECNQACLCNRLTCKNRVVQHGITARFQLFRTKGNKGWGVSTLRIIPKGSYVCEYIGEIISDCEADTREDDSYLFDLDNRDGETYCIDARRYGNIARFINHSCVPNLLPVRVFINHQDLHFPRIAFFANRDIEANEELGFDYGEKFWIIKYKLFTCTCAAENCRYSESTIEKTLASYNTRLKQELDDSH